MPQPLNYMLDTAMPNPVGGFLQGIQLVQKMQEQQAAQEQAEKRKTILAALGPKSTPEQILQASLQLPDDADAIQKSWSAMGKAREDALWNAGSDVYQQVQAGDVDTAKAMAEKWAKGFETAGDDENAEKMRTAVQMLEKHPETAEKTIGLMLSLASPEKFSKLGEKTAAIQNWEYFKTAIGPEEAKRVIGADDDIITNLPNDGFYAGPRSGLAEVLKGLMGQGGAAAPLPTVTNDQEYNDLPRGSAYIDPTGKRRFKPGGPTPLASGNFRP
jgi:hypothetical protein